MAGNTSSTTTFRADISNLKKAMQEASRQVRLANSEFKAASAGMDDWSKSADGLSAKLKQLNTTYAAQKRQLSLMEDELEKTTKEYGENSAAADRVRIRMNNQKAAIAKTEKQLNQYERELEDCKNGSGKFADELDDVNDSATKASDGFTTMKGVLANLVADGIRLAVDAMKDLAKETYTVGANFESAMSQVEAVSGATSAEIEALTDKAKEMGETTKFSATESAEAFNYMAMAGWKTEDMIDGISGIMSLAAASGEDLATTSDIVTDALTAMGYSAKDSGRLADVMAAASSNANTNVAMMGSTFQYAAPIVGALGYSMEDTAVAIGLMANAGIKGDKAGTALRSTLTRLSAPPKECAEAMGELGISMTDSNGKMKPFNKVIKDLRKSFKGLSETQQTQYAKAIAGQEAMSGLLAIVNAAPADFNKLTKAVEKSNGAAQDMADTMNDNVAGQMTLLRSKIEGIMIKIFEKIAPQLRKAIDEISKTLDDVDWDGFAEGAGNATQKLVELFKFIVNNGDTILSILKTIAVAFVTYKAVTTIMAVYGAFSALFTAIKAGTGVMAALNSTMLLSPWGLVAAAVAGLTFGIYEYVKSVDKAIEKEYGLTSAQKETIDRVNELTDEYKQMDDARKESLKNIDAEYDHIEDLKDEYNGLINSNGKVKKGYEDRAEFILGELAKAMGVERDEIQKLINKNGKLGKSIDKVIEKKRAEAMLNAGEDGYQKAIQNKDEALQKYQETQEQVTEAEKKYAKAQKEAQKAWKELDDAVNRGSTSQIWKQSAYTEAAAAEKKAKEALDKEKKAVKDAENTYVGYMATIKNYEGLSAAIISGDSKKIQTELKNMENAFISADLGTSRTLQDQAKNMKKNYESLQQAVKNGMGGVTQADVDASKAMVDKANKELYNYFKKSDIAAEAKKAGVKIPKSLKEGIISGSTDLDSATKQLGNLIKFDEAVKNAGLDGKKIPKELSEGVMSGETTVDDAIKRLKSSAKKELDKSNGEKEAGKEKGQFFADGIKSVKKKAENAGKELAKEAKKGADTKDETTNSETSGSNFGKGFWNGIGNWLTKVFNRGKELAQQGTKGLKEGQKEGSPSKITTQSGIYFGEGFNNGIKSMTKTVVKTAGKLGTGAVQSLRDAQEEHSPSKLTYKSGVNFTKGYINGISSMQKGLVKTAKGLVLGATKELLKLNNFNFSEVQQKASNIFSESMSNKISYMSDKMAYQNEKKIADFDKTIANLEKKRDKKIKDLEKKENKKNKKQIQKQINDVKSQYNKLIKTQEKYKEAYQTASSEMLEEFNAAIGDYQAKAQALIDDTMNGITETYQARYDDLIGKQDNLINKLKSAGDLFEISGAGVFRMTDIKEQTQQIKDYADKLKKIKSKVSGDLFDQITEYDMKEGSFFIDQLLGMSEAELKAYDQAYTEKMNLAEKLSKDIYKQDFDQVAKDYKTAINKAMKGLPKQLEALGNQAMKGFVNGLTKNTDYLDKNVKTFVKGMVNQFKKELKIHSPSRVMMGLGEYSGEGFGNGLINMIGYVKKAASNIADAASTSLSDVKGNISGMKSEVNANQALMGSNTTIINNYYDLVQNNTSPKSLSALDTYRARRQQIDMVKAATQSI